MIKKLAWNTFKQTGDIGTFLELKEFEKIQYDFRKEEKGYDVFGMGTENQLDNNVQQAVNDFWNKIDNKQGF